MKTIHRYLFFIIACVALSLAVTYATYFYSYVSDWTGWTWSVNRGWPLSWAVERHVRVLFYPEPIFYPYDFQAPGFSIDLVFWATIFLIPSSLYLWRKSSQLALRKASP